MVTKGMSSINLLNIKEKWKHLSVIFTLSPVLYSYFMKHSSNIYFLTVHSPCRRSAMYFSHSIRAKRTFLARQLGDKINSYYRKRE